MTRPLGALLGAVVTLAVVVLGGGVFGFITGAAPCHGRPFTLDCGLFGAAVFSAFLGLPALIIGAASGATFARGLRGVNINALMGLVAAVAGAIAVGLQHHP